METPEMSLMDAAYPTRVRVGLGLPLNDGVISPIVILTMRDKEIAVALNPGHAGFLITQLVRRCHSLGGDYVTQLRAALFEVANEAEGR